LFNAFKIKIHSLLVARKPKGFVNPYLTAAPRVHPKLNPYISQYDTKKLKTLAEVIRDNLISEKISERLVINKLGEPFPELKQSTQPTFAHDMKEMFIGDLLWVAGKFKEKIPVKEKRMTYNEIMRACENTKW